MNNFVQALLLGILFWLSKWSIGYNWTIRWATIPMIMSLPIGIIMGNVKDAVILGAYMQTIYLGIVSGLGGVITVDKALAAVLTIPIALKTGMSPEIAITMAIPFGLIGTLVSNTSKFVHSWFNQIADRYALEANAKGIRRLAFLYPPLVLIPLTILPVTAIVYLGPDAVQAVLDAIPEWLINGMTVAGGLLPAMGFAMTIRAIGRKSLLPFFFLGFFIMKYADLTIIGSAIFGLIMAIVYVQLMGGKTSDQVKG